MKRKVKRAATILIFTLAAALCVAIAMAARALAAIQGLPIDGGRDISQPSVFHFIAILPATEASHYYRGALAGMRAAGGELKAVIQVFEYGAGTGRDALRDLIGMAGELDPDGIVLSVPVVEEFVPLVEGIRKRVPVVTLETDLPEQARAAFIGTNAFRFGQEGGRLLLRGVPGEAKVAVVLSQLEGESAVRNDTILLGLAKALQERPGVELALARRISDTPFASEEVIRDILTGRPDINAIICTDYRFTESAANALIEYNRVGAVTLVGFGDSPEIRRFISEGVLFGSLTRDPELAGRVAVKVLVDLRRKQGSSAYLDTGISPITKENLAGM